jgi:NADH-quinone oxidoreductase subunit B
MIKELVRPTTNFNMMVSRVGDVLVKVLDTPLGYAINWESVWSLWPVHLETACCSVEYGAVEGPRYDIERFGMPFCCFYVRKILITCKTVIC